MLVCKDYALTPKRERPFETERAGEGVQDPKAMHFVADVSINDVEVLKSATCNFFFNILLEKPWKFKAVRRQRAKQTPSGFLTRVTSSAGSMCLTHLTSCTSRFPVGIKVGKRTPLNPICIRFDRSLPCFFTKGPACAKRATAQGQNMALRTRHSDGPGSPSRTYAPRR